INLFLIGGCRGETQCESVCTFD
ncbi:hypothetical protein VCHENC02_1539B, partial [Vibrio harveyi]